MKHSHSVNEKQYQRLTREANRCQLFDSFCFSVLLSRGMCRNKQSYSRIGSAEQERYLCTGYTLNRWTRVKLCARFKNM